ncbi:glycosyltransferase [uncultured Enterococcus sp.]|uniref:glycosyltransferase n=1 Tax=uncultured Enterococcus sp. TaxID=167972 RepID=UPI002AA8C1CD|nr:glycosyltransferase [uncultured Enterococcus sp.]
MTASEKIRIDVIAVPFSGHLYPLLEVMTPLLQNERYSIRFITGVQKIKTVEALGFYSFPLFPEHPTIMEDIANTETQAKLTEMYQQLKQNVTLVPKAVQQIEHALIENQTDIVIADFISVPAGVVCERLAIPWITTIPTPFALETKDGTPSYIGGWRSKSGSLYHLRDFFGRKLVRTVKKGFFFLIRKEASALGITLYNDKGEEAIYSPLSILGMGMEELEVSRTFPKQFKWIGPCCDSPEKEEIMILDKTAFRQTILVTLGTHLLWGKKAMKKQLLEIAAHFPEYLFVLSLGDSKRADEHEKIGENVYQYGYIPYSRNMAQFDYVIHHGGAGILYNCIKYQKPALILPHDYDQFDYAVRAEHAGIAMTTKKKKTKQVIGKLRELLQKSEWPELERLGKQFSNYNPSQVVDEEIQRLMKMVRK